MRPLGLPSSTAIAFRLSSLPRAILLLFISIILVDRIVDLQEYRWCRMVLSSMYLNSSKVKLGYCRPTPEA
ncbi:hypothetical protein PM082_000745 [Marasmius tenuissimus]|nr:hypothetical protein PM082_000745 [Marasmius tenuissimus]